MDNEKEVKPYYHALFAYMSKTYGILLVDSEMDEIVRIVEGLRTPANSSEAAHKALDLWYHLWDKDILGWEKGEPTEAHGMLFSKLLDTTRECLGMDKLPPVANSSEDEKSICCACRCEMQHVRPGKWQCNNCENIESMERHCAELQSRCEKLSERLKKAEEVIEAVIYRDSISIIEMDSDNTEEDVWSDAVCNAHDLCRFYLHRKIKKGSTNE